MSPEAAKPELLINPDVLVWARTRMGLSEDDAAEKVPVKVERLIAWETKKASPTLNQARKLAKIYCRPFLEFFAAEVPAVEGVTLVPDYRLHRDRPTPKDEAVRADIQGWAETQRLNALDLLDMLGDTPTALPQALASSVTEATESAAERAREAIGFTIHEQFDLPVSDKRLIPERLRARMSDSGVLVLKRSDIKKIGMRGMCLFSETLPIVVYGNEAPGAQAFTLAHELGHIAIQSSGISGPAATGKAVERVEDWCNRFASDFLIPRRILADVWPRPDRQMTEISDDQLHEVARRFGVSPHAMLVRLVSLSYVRPAYYWGVKRQQFLREEAEYTPPPMRASYYGSRYKNSLGNFYTGLVLEAWGTGTISGHNAAEFLGIKNIRHLSDIRERFPR
ncbi:XRE family transcriptional regulator [Hyphomonas sp.]|uniref:XRE family transcriptional regulator n=1 Tax=Hyphomonas sp. TaxID=87 RepID=UPI003267BB8D